MTNRVIRFIYMIVMQAWFLLKYCFLRLWWAIKKPQSYFKRISSPTQYYSKICAWRDREGDDWPAGQPGAPIDMELAIQMHKEMLRSWKSMLDPDQFGKKDFWAGHRQSEKTRTGDCEDFAILLMAQLLYEGFDRDKVAVCIVPGHALCILMHTDDDFMVLDNGALSRVPAPASKLFPYDYNGQELAPVCGFNFQSSWVYVKI